MIWSCTILCLLSKFCETKWISYMLYDNFKVSLMILNKISCYWVYGASQPMLNIFVLTLVDLSLLFLSLLFLSLATTKNAPHRDLSLRRGLGVKSNEIYQAWSLRAYFVGVACFSTSDVKPMFSKVCSSVASSCLYLQTNQQERRNCSKKKYETTSVRKSPLLPYYILCSC